MSVKRFPFGTTADGRQIERYEIRNGDLTVSVLTYGATLQSAVYRGVDVVLGYDDGESYQNSGCSFGSTVGRVANRIKGDRITVAGQDYAIAANDHGKNHLHGGVRGFGSRLWSAEIHADEEAVTLRRTSPDGEEGYPGTLSLSVTFAVTGDSRLRITYKAVSTADTLLNLTNHAYFNLEGHDGPSVRDHLLQVEAEQITVSDAELIPTGELLAVEDTPFDFREPKPIGRDIDAPHPLLQNAGGYDHNFVLGTDGAFRRAATAQAPLSGIRMECWTDLPGVQLYTANFLNEPHCKGGVSRGKGDGFCLETQHWPDAVHHPHFPSIALAAGEVFRSKTEYRFFGKN